MRQVFILIGAVILVLCVAAFVSHGNISLSTQDQAGSKLFATDNDGSPEKYRSDSGWLYATDNDGSPEKNKADKGALFATDNDGSPEKNKTDRGWLFATDNDGSPK